MEKTKISKFLHKLRYIWYLWLNKTKYPKNVRWKAVIQKKLFHNDCYICRDGSVFSISKDGNIEGLCKNKKNKFFTGKMLLDIVVSSGGKKCTAIGKYLYDFYTKNGFRPACWCKFDWKLAPKGATKAEPLIFYYFTGKPINIPYKKFLQQNPEKGYEEAYKKRDLCLKRWIRRQNERSIY